MMRRGDGAGPNPEVHFLSPLFAPSARYWYVRATDSEKDASWHTSAGTWLQRVVISASSRLYDSTNVNTRKFLGVVDAGVSLSDLEDLLVSLSPTDTVSYVMDKDSGKLLVSNIPGASGKLCPCALVPLPPPRVPAVTEPPADLLDGCLVLFTRFELRRLLGHVHVSRRLHSVQRHGKHERSHRRCRDLPGGRSTFCEPPSLGRLLDHGGSSHQHRRPRHLGAHRLPRAGLSGGGGLLQKDQW